MSKGMNIVQIAGHLGADPETRVTPSGQKVTTFRMAVNGKKGGSEYTVWWRVTVWGDNRLLPYLKKGSAVIVIGDMSKPEIYTDKEGRPQVSLEITAEIIRFSPFGRNDRQEETNNTSYGSSNSYEERSNNSFSSNSFGGFGSFEPSMAEKEDEVPF
ncbi:Helix-destabilizing protein [Candidatus Rubidus massiliensis]|nr:MAG: hypothetical protein BGO10_06505 [Chlamydia sp. 32-24]CDZ80511.1 Helix-destabilizing protein [Candidatus Rubidus massiliensis]